MIVITSYRIGGYNYGSRILISMTLQAPALNMSKAFSKSSCPYCKTPINNARIAVTHPFNCKSADASSILTEVIKEQIRADIRASVHLTKCIYCDKKLPDTPENQLYHMLRCASRNVKAPSDEAPKFVSLVNTHATEIFNLSCEIGLLKEGDWEVKYKKVSEDLDLKTLEFSEVLSERNLEIDDLNHRLELAMKEATSLGSTKYNGKYKPNSPCDKVLPLKARQEIASYYKINVNSFKTKNEAVRLHCEREEKRCLYREESEDESQTSNSEASPSEDEDEDEEAVNYAQDRKPNASYLKSNW